MAPYRLSRRFEVTLLAETLAYRPAGSLEQDADPPAPVTDTSNKADTVFFPILENALKAQKLQSTLSIFEKSKFFFNLPGSILASIKAVSHGQPLGLWHPSLRS